MPSVEASLSIAFLEITRFSLQEEEYWVAPRVLSHLCHQSRFQSLKWLSCYQALDPGLLVGQATY